MVGLSPLEPSTSSGRYSGVLWGDRGVEGGLGAEGARLGHAYPGRHDALKSLGPFQGVQGTSHEG